MSLDRLLSELVSRGYDESLYRDIYSMLKRSIGLSLNRRISSSQVSPHVTYLEQIKQCSHKTLNRFISKQIHILEDVKLTSSKAKAIQRYSVLSPQLYSRKAMRRPSAIYPSHVVSLCVYLYIDCRLMYTPTRRQVDQVDRRGTSRGVG